MESNREYKYDKDSNLPKSTNFQNFCVEMTTFSTKQIEFHKEEYFKISQKVFKRLMEWYSEVRQTNDESEQCAIPIMRFMDEMFINIVIFKVLNIW